MCWLKTSTFVSTSPRCATTSARPNHFAGLLENLNLDENLIDEPKHGVTLVLNLYIYGQLRELHQAEDVKKY